MYLFCHYSFGPVGMDTGGLAFLFLGGEEGGGERRGKGGWGGSGRWTAHFTWGVGVEMGEEGRRMGEDYFPALLFLIRAESIC